VHCLPVCRPLHAAGVGLLLWAQWAGDIDRQQQAAAERHSAANASSATLLADIGS